MFPSLDLRTILVNSSRMFDDFHHYLVSFASFLLPGPQPDRQKCDLERGNKPFLHLRPQMLRRLNHNRQDVSIDVTS